ncbi:hypothetical protein EST38_g12639 [Candolleomyces aberdarensis]|uniref:Uncharacterized protein n=1 Tax=Candolleomyces aberdarensis TaxID=2316362 RepID=A0A4Q2D4X9_9AGAR|nr:hypothetical protein EST38_g12639 [Candolleomyces aberdarensis]
MTQTAAKAAERRGAEAAAFSDASAASSDASATPSDASANIYPDASARMQPGPPLRPLAPPNAAAGDMAGALPARAGFHSAGGVDPPGAFEHGYFNMPAHTQPSIQAYHPRPLMHPSNSARSEGVPSAGAGFRSAGGVGAHGALARPRLGPGPPLGYRLPRGPSGGHPVDGRHAYLPPQRQHAGNGQGEPERFAAANQRPRPPHNMLTEQHHLAQTHPYLSPHSFDPDFHEGAQHYARLYEGASASLTLPPARQSPSPFGADLSSSTSSPEWHLSANAQRAAEYDPNSLEALRMELPEHALVELTANGATEADMEREAHLEVSFRSQPPSAPLQNTSHLLAMPTRTSSSTQPVPDAHSSTPGTENHSSPALSPTPSAASAHLPSPSPPPSAQPSAPFKPTSRKWAGIPQRITKKELDSYPWDPPFDFGVPQGLSTPSRKQQIEQELFGTPTPKAQRGSSSTLHRAQSLDPSAVTPRPEVRARRATSEQPNVDAETDDGSEDLPSSPTPDPFRKMGGKFRRLAVILSDDEVSDGDSGKRGVGVASNGGTSGSDGEGDEVDQGEESRESGESGESEVDEEGSVTSSTESAEKAGRPTKEENRIADKAANSVEKIIDKTSKRLKRSRRFVVNRINKHLSPAERITVKPSDWSYYVGYYSRHTEEEHERLGDSKACATKENFESFKKAYPDDWLELIETDHALSRSKVHKNLGERQTSFNKFCQSVTDLISSAELLGFEALFVACGSVVNEDGNLGTYHQTKHLQGFVEKRLKKGMTPDSFLGQAKSHVIDACSKEYVEDDVQVEEVDEGEALPSEDGDSPALNSDQIFQLAVATNDSKIIQLARSLRSKLMSEIESLTLDRCRPIIKSYLYLYFGLLGKIFGRSSIPWGKYLRAYFAKLAVRVINWPTGIVMLGEGEYSDGIKGLGSVKVTALTKALHKGKIQFVLADKQALKLGKIPIVEEAAPPADSSQKSGRRLFLDGSIDYSGLRRLMTTSAKQPTPGPSSSKQPMSKALASKQLASSSLKQTPPEAPPKKKTSTKTAKEKIPSQDPAPAARSRSTLSKNKGKQRKAATDSSDDNMPLAPHPCKKPSKLESIPLSKRPPVLFVDDSNDEQFVPDSGDETASPKHQRRRSNPPTGEEDLYDGSSDENTAPVAESGPPSTTAPALSPTDGSLLTPAERKKKKPSQKPPAATSTNKGQASEPDTPNASTSSTSAPNVPFAGPLQPATAVSPSTATVSRNPSTSHPDNHPHGPVPRPRPVLPSSKNAESNPFSMDLDDRFTIRRKRKSDALPTEGAPTTQEDSREKRARMETESQTPPPSVPGSETHVLLSLPPNPEQSSIAARAQHPTQASFEPSGPHPAPVHRRQMQAASSLTTHQPPTHLAIQRMPPTNQQPNSYYTSRNFPPQSSYRHPSQYRQPAYYGVQDYTHPGEYQNYDHSEGYEYAYGYGRSGTYDNGYSDGYENAYVDEYNDYGGGYGYLSHHQPASNEGRSPRPPTQQG